VLFINILHIENKADSPPEHSSSSLCGGAGESFPETARPGLHPVEHRLHKHPDSSFSCIGKLLFAEVRLTVIVDFFEAASKTGENS